MYTILSLIAVGLLWGATNPFIKRGSQGIEKISQKKRSSLENFRLEIKSIGSRLHYWVPFLLNQSGSVLFVYTLQHSPLTATVPIANSLSFAFTAITGYFLGEKLPGKKIVIGTVLVVLGSSLMIYDKLLNEEKQQIEVKFSENIPQDFIR